MKFYFTSDDDSRDNFEGTLGGIEHGDRFKLVQAFSFITRAVLLFNENRFSVYLLIFYKDLVNKNSLFSMYHFFSCTK